MSKRIDWLDYTKGFGILMIMLAHVTQYIPIFSGINRYICSFHVPIFFIAAGCLGEKRRSNFSKKRIVSLLIPYIVFSAINFCLKIGVCLITKSLSQELLKSELIELFITGNGTVWFLPCLCLVEIIGEKICNSKVKDLLILITSVVLFIFAFCLPISHNPFGIFIIRIIAGSGYYCVGYFMSRQHIFENAGVVLGGCLLGVGIFAELVFNHNIDFFLGRFAYIIPSLICSICSSMGYMLLFVKLENCSRKVVVGLQNVLQYYGFNSLIVMLVHPIILQMIMYPFGEYISSMQGIVSGVTGIIIYIGLIIAVIPCIKIINTFCPILIGKRSKVGVRENE